MFISEDHLIGVIQELASLYDEPFAIHHKYHFLVSKLARTYVCGSDKRRWGRSFWRLHPLYRPTAEPIDARTRTTAAGRFQSSLGTTHFIWGLLQLLGGTWAHWNK